MGLLNVLRQTELRTPPKTEGDERGDPAVNKFASIVFHRVVSDNVEMSNISCATSVKSLVHGLDSCAALSHDASGEVT